MPQHLWHTYGNDRRFCDACEVSQIKKQGRWEPEVSSICPGDGRDTSNRRRPRPRVDGPMVKQLDPA
jgi:hypothetical protein